MRESTKDVFAIARQ